MLHLYKFSFENNIEYVVSTLTDIDEIRYYVRSWDHGGTGADLFYNTFKKGVGIEITDVNEVDDVTIIPYSTDEKIKETDYLEFDFTIEDFFSGAYKNELRIDS